MGGSAKTDFVCYKGPKSADDGGRVGQKIKKIADVSCVRPPWGNSRGTSLLISMELFLPTKICFFLKTCHKFRLLAITTAVCFISQGLSNQAVSSTAMPICMRLTVQTVRKILNVHYVVSI